MFELSTDTTNIDWNEVQKLFVAVGWGERDVVDIRAAFEKSTHKFFAHRKRESNNDSHNAAEQQLAGFGRTTDDGVNYALICDLVVAPEFQGSGIGTQLLSALKDACADFRFVTLTAAEGKDGFYLKQGWQRQTSSFIWPRDEKQARIHAKNSQPFGENDECLHR